MTCQSWRSEKNVLLAFRLLSKTRFELLQGRIVFGLPTMTGHIFSTPRAIMMYSNSFETLKPYIFSVCSIKGVVALSRALFYSKIPLTLEYLLAKGTFIVFWECRNCLYRPWPIFTVVIVPQYRLLSH